MAFGFFWDDTNYTADTDDERGREILLSFHTANLGFDSYPFQSLDQLLDHYGSVGKVLPEGMGLVQRQLGMDVEEAKELMDELAYNSQGKIPSNWMAFQNALKDKAMNPSFIDAVFEVVPGAAGDLIDTAVDIGKGVQNTLKLSGFMMPVLLWGGGAFAIYMMTKAFSKPISNLDLNRAIKDIKGK